MNCTDGKAIAKLSEPEQDAPHNFSKGGKPRGRDSGEIPKGTGTKKRGSLKGSRVIMALFFH